MLLSKTSPSGNDDGEEVGEPSLFEVEVDLLGPARRGHGHGHPGSAQPLEHGDDPGKHAQMAACRSVVLGHPLLQQLVAQGQGGEPAEVVQDRLVGLSDEGFDLPNRGRDSVASEHGQPGGEAQALAVDQDAVTIEDDSEHEGPRVSLMSAACQLAFERCLVRRNQRRYRFRQSHRIGWTVPR